MNPDDPLWPESFINPNIVANAMADVSTSAELTIENLQNLRKQMRDMARPLLKLSVFADVPNTRRNWYDFRAIQTVIDTFQHMREVPDRRRSHQSCIFLAGYPVTGLGQVYTGNGKFGFVITLTCYHVDDDSLLTRRREDEYLVAVVRLRNHLKPSLRLINSETRRPEISGAQRMTDLLIGVESRCPDCQKTNCQLDHLPDLL